jgi:hypothetical protein
MFKRIFIIGLLTLVIIVAVVVFLHWRTNAIGCLIQELINYSLTETVQIQYKSLSGDIFQNITLEDVTATFEDGSVITSNQLRIKYSLFANISQKYRFSSIMFDSIYVFLNLPLDSVADLSESEEDSMEDMLNRWASSAYYDSLFASLPELALGRLAISHGKVEIPSASLTLDSVSVKLSAHSNSESFGITIDNIKGKWVERNFILDYFHTQLIGKPERITLNQLQIKTPHSHAYANGEIDISENLLVILNLEDIQLTAFDLISLFKLQDIDSGQINLSFHAVGSPNRFSSQFSAYGDLNNYRLDSLIIDGDYAQGEIIVNRGKIMANESRIDFNGKILDNMNMAQLKFSNLDINRLFPEAVHTDLSGSLYLLLDKLNLKNITGSGELLLYNSYIDSMRFDSLRFALEAFNNNFKIIEPSFLKLGENSKFTVKGELNRYQKVDFNLYTENNSLVSLTSAFNLDSIYGVFDGNLFLSGDLLNPDIEGFIWIPTLSKQELKLDSLILQIKLEQLSTQRVGDAFMTIMNGKYGTIEFTEIRADLLFKGNIIEIDTLLFANRENYISSSGYFDYNSDTISLGFDFFRIYYENYWIENDGQILFSSDSQEINIEQALFSAPDNGIIELRGVLNQSDEDMQFGILMQNINISPLKQFIKTEMDFSGIIEADFELFYSPSHLELDVTMLGHDLSYNKIPFGSIDCGFQLKDNNIYVSNFKMLQGDSRIELDGDVAMSIGLEGKKSVNILEESLADLKITWENINLNNYGSLLNLTRPLKGKISGDLGLAGTLTNPEGEINIYGDDITYDKFIADSLIITGKFKNDSLILEYLSADLNETTIEGDGLLLMQMDFTNPDTMISKRPFVLNLRSIDDKIEFIQFLNDQVERITGQFELDLQINGTLEKPALHRGFIKLNDGELELSRVRNRLLDVKIDAEIENNLMTIKTFSAQAVKKKDFLQKTYGLIKRLFRLFGGSFKPEGVVDIDGTIRFKDLLHPELNLSMDMYQLYVDYFIENTELVISCNDLKISGRDTINLAGSLDIDEGAYIVDLAKLQKNIYLSETSAGEVRTLAWNLDLSLPGNFMISSSKLDLVNNFQFEISGDIRSIQEPHNPSMGLTGSMEILTGKYGSWGQDFEIQSGTIKFINPEQINPEIDILAEKRSRGHIFELSILGNLEKQQLNLQVKDENHNYLNYSMSDKITLLSLGTTTSNLQPADFATARHDVITTSVETAIGRGMESITGLDRVEVDLESKVVDLESTKLNDGLSDASISFGKYLTSNLYLEYKSQLGEGTIPAPKLSWAPGNQISLEYRFNKNWSINSFYAQTHRGNNLIQLSLYWKTTF